MRHHRRRREAVPSVCMEGLGRASAQLMHSLPTGMREWVGMLMEPRGNTPTYLQREPKAPDKASPEPCLRVGAKAMRGRATPRQGSAPRWG